VIPLPTLVPNTEPDPEPLDDVEALIAAMPPGQLTMLANQGFTVQDALDGKVPGIDAEKLLAEFRADD
jgi:hypothetical protein